MARSPFTEEERNALKASVRQLHKADHTIREIAERLNITQGTVAGYVHQMQQKGELAHRRPERAHPIRDDSVVRQEDEETISAQYRKEPERKVWILAHLQTDAPFHEGMWRNLKAYARHRDAEIVVSTSTRYQDSGVVPKDVKPHVRNHNFYVAPGVLWLGAVKVGLTTRNPLTSLGVGEGKWGHLCNHYILPHPQLAMSVVHGINSLAARHVFSTGSITEPRCGDTKGAFLSDNMHKPCALVLETDEEGGVWVRQLVGNNIGTFQDLGVEVRFARVHLRPDDAVALVSGDCHFSRMTFGMRRSVLELVNDLRPKVHVMHDVMDGYTVNRHTRDDRFRNFAKQVRDGRLPKSVAEELHLTVQNINEIVAQTYGGTEHAIIQSNHDDWIYDWALRHDTSRDVLDMEEWHRVNLDILESVKGCQVPGWFERVLRRHGLIGLGDGGRVTIRQNGESFHLNGVEYSCHGDKGLSGRAGSISAFSRVAHPVTIAHSHSPAIMGEAYRVGICADLEQGYNRGMTDWAVSSCVHYQCGGRSLITMNRGKWHMNGDVYGSVQGEVDDRS